MRLNLAQAYMISGKNRAAVEEVNRIYPEYLRRLGPDHELIMQLLTTRAQCEATLGLWDEAIHDDLAIHRIAVRKQAPASLFAVATLSDAALAECRAGRAGDGEPNARKAYETSARTCGPRAGLTGGAAYALASCDTDNGKLGEASGLLADIDSKLVAQLAGFADWSANVAPAQAQITYHRRDYAGARKQLALAVPVFSKADAEPYQKRAVETLAAALAHARL